MACRKSLLNDEEYPSAPSGFGVKEAKTFFENSTQSASSTIKLASIDSARNPNPTGFTYWKQAKAYTMKQFNVVEVPLIVSNRTISLHDFPGDSVKLKPDASVARAILTRLIIFQNVNTKSVEKEIVTYFPDKAYLLRHENDASDNWLNHISSDFSGYIEYRNWNSTPKYLLRMSGGKKVARYNIRLLQSGGSNKTIQSTIKTMDIHCFPVCEEAYNTNCITIDGVEDCVDVDSGYEECYDYCYDDGSNPPDPQPQDPGDGDNGGVIGGGTPSSPPPTVTNDLTGCNGSVVNKLMDKNISNNISKILQDVFNKNDKTNLHFVSSTNTNGAPAITIVTSGANSTTVNMEIRINPDVLPSDASQDYKASIIIHEIIHAYLDYKKIDYNNQLKQHADLARDYISDIATMLHDAFGTDTENANALAFGGLKDFATKNPTEYADLLKAKDLTEGTRDFDSEMQRTGLHGTPCP